MKIVIDIPQGLKIDFENENWTALTCAEMKNALMRGTQLPKNHGRLIDADALKLSKERHTEMDEYNWNVEHTYYTYYYAEKEIKNAPTIIEADKEDKHG